MSKRRKVCPECGGQLIRIRTHIVVEERMVNPATGVLGKAKVERQTDRTTDYVCTNCHWSERNEGGL